MDQLNNAKDNSQHTFVLAMCRPWVLLVAPRRMWTSLRTNSTSVLTLLSPVIAQWLLLASTQLLALHAVQELAMYSGLSKQAIAAGPLSVFLQLILYAAGIACANVLIALVIWGIVGLTSIKSTFRQAFVITAYSLIPAVLGHALGFIVFAITQPLTRNTGHAIALLASPFSFGAASFTNLSAQPLSLGWIFASYLDVFGVWSIAILLCGAFFYLGATKKQVFWLAISTMVSLGLVFSGLWRLLQLMAL